MDAPKLNNMNGINAYGTELTPDKIVKKEHREFVGGLWEEMGILQFDFLKSHGLAPHHKLLDVGCGCLRGGLLFIDYLDPKNYFGLDVNASLIVAAEIEVAEAGLTAKQPNLLVDDQFAFDRFAEKMDFMVSVSVFTHLPMNPIIRCLAQAKKTLKPTGVYYATFFQAPFSAHLENLAHEPGGIVTKYDADPFHYSQEEMSWMAQVAGLKVDFIGDWNHPRDQRMAAFTINS